MFARAARPLQHSSKFFSTSAFGETRKDSMLWFAKATAGSALLGFAVSEFVLTDERMESINNSWDSLLNKSEEYGISLPFRKAHAFSTADHGLHPPHFPWEFDKFYKTFDHAALRRGYQVYREICAACHSMDFIYWRNLVGVTHTEAEAKTMAEEYEYKDGPNDQGEYFMRPGKLSDPLPRPYPNDEAARVANAGALPPDLSCISRARKGNMNYLFALLLGYTEPPAGINIREGLHYNPYFPGGAIGMARSVYDEVVDYEDGTPNSASQIAKDVSEFLHWASYPENDERKRMGLKFLAVTSVLLGISIWWKRHKWSYIKSRQVVYKAPKVIQY
ncbi:cytochrome c1 [Terramyces sp. JEL0728]|nr:cytochrome c1 [Terramyces sp. JEL0728]